MAIKNSTFVAFTDARPGHESFTVFGRVAVPHPGVVPVLTKPMTRHKGGWEVLKLTFEQLEGIYPQVVTEVFVHYTEPRVNHWKMLEIIAEEDGERMPIFTRTY